jgi:predicted nucleic acid-binding protein
VALFYADASALVKLVREEAESDALRAFVEDADLISSELVLTEVPRAIRRAVADDPNLPLDALLDKAAEVLDAVAFLPIDHALLIAAGGLVEPALRALDAIHVSASVSIAPFDAFVSYDERQSAAARLSGLRTVAPAELGAYFDEEAKLSVDELDRREDRSANANAHEAVREEPW